MMFNIDPADICLDQVQPGAAVGGPLMANAAQDAVISVNIAAAGAVDGLFPPIALPAAVAMAYALPAELDFADHWGTVAGEGAGATAAYGACVLNSIFDGNENGVPGSWPDAGVQGGIPDDASMGIGTYDMAAFAADLPPMGNIVDSAVPSSGGSADAPSLSPSTSD